jgi:hypothetical protein
MAGSEKHCANRFRAITGAPGIHPGDSVIDLQAVSDQPFLRSFFN